MPNKGLTSEKVLRLSLEYLLNVEFSADLVAFSKAYGWYVLLFACLSTITAYRRQISCNRVYSKSTDDGRRGVHPLSPSLRASLLSFAFYHATEASNRRQEIKNLLLLHHKGKTMAERIAALFAELHGSAWTDAISDRGEIVLNREGSSPDWTILAKSGARDEGNLLNCKQHLSFPTDLPPDLQVLVLSFLHPRDVANLACVSRSWRDTIDSGESSQALWQTLWTRDFGWIVNSWEVGKEAMMRSCVDPVHSKEFYFLFGLSYMNYILAGHNTASRCLLGIRGNVYDITDFLVHHPGSPDTVLVHAGKDVTELFDDMGHSMVARRLSREFCVLVDERDSHHSSVIKPTAVLARTADSSLPHIAYEIPSIKKRREPDVGNGTLQRFRDRFVSEKFRCQEVVEARFQSNSSVLGDVNLFFDPFRMEWKCWYTGMTFENVFLKLD